MTKMSMILGCMMKLYYVTGFFTWLFMWYKIISENHIAGLLSTQRFGVLRLLFLVKCKLKYMISTYLGGILVVILFNIDSSRELMVDAP